MYFADTPRETVRAYDYDVDTGEATNERVFLDFGPLPAGRTGRPSTRPAATGSRASWAGW